MGWRHGRSYSTLRRGGFFWQSRPFNTWSIIVLGRFVSIDYLTSVLRWWQRRSQNARIGSCYDFSWRRCRCIAVIVGALTLLQMRRERWTDGGHFVMYYCLADVRRSTWMIPSKVVVKDASPRLCSVCQATTGITANLAVPHYYISLKKGAKKPQLLLFPLSFLLFIETIAIPSGHLLDIKAATYKRVLLYYKSTSRRSQRAPSSRTEQQPQSPAIQAYRAYTTFWL